MKGSFVTLTFVHCLITLLFFMCFLNLSSYATNVIHEGPRFFVSCNGASIQRQKYHRHRSEFCCTLAVQTAMYVHGVPELAVPENSVLMPPRRRPAAPQRDLYELSPDCVCDGCWLWNMRHLLVRRQNQDATSELQRKNVGVEFLAKCSR